MVEVVKKRVVPGRGRRKKCGRSHPAGKHRGVCERWLGPRGEPHEGDCEGRFLARWGSKETPITIGRIVRIAQLDDTGARVDRVGLVTNVYDDKSVDLYLPIPNIRGVPFSAEGVAGTWHWPPR